MPEDDNPKFNQAGQEQGEGDIMAGDRRLSRPDSALPDWYMSDAAYRPIPIVWFAGAMMAQVIAQPIAFLVTGSLNFPAWLMIATAALVSVLIGKWAWKRGIGGAGMGWKIVTICMLVFFMGFSVLGALPRL